MVKICLGLVLLIFSGVLSSTSLQGYWVFYQPQYRDNDITLLEWKEMLANLKLEGAKGIVFQWSSVDESSTLNSAQMQRLKQIFTLAEQQKLKVIIGLHADSDFFKRIKQPANSLYYYFNKQSTMSVGIAKQWQSVWQSDVFSGWYITQEVDDYHWRELNHRRLLLQFLETLHAQLSLLGTNKPVYISAYLGGFQSVTITERLLKDISLNGKIKVWLQDGLGTGALNVKQRRYYFSSLLACNENIDKGVVYEYFREQKQAKSFSAIAATTKQWQHQLDVMKNYCHTQKLIFSLRYLPVAKGVLNL